MKGMNFLFLDCEKAALLVNMQGHKSISRVKRFQLYVHLLICKDCEQYSKDLKWLDSQLDSYSKESVSGELYHLSSKKKNRMKEMITLEETHL